MPTYSALTIAVDRDKAQRLGDTLEAFDPAPYGVGVFEIEDGSGDWEIGAYFFARPDEIALDLLAAALGARPFVVSEVPDIDWVAHVKRQLRPVEAGRFFVYGSHDAEKVPPGRIALCIETAMAFGTGHHGTTKGCLIALDKLVGDGFEPRRVADIGCGTAVLAMAAARVFPVAEVIAGDIDPVAVEVAGENIRANGLEGRITCVEAAGFGHISMDQSRLCGLIFANILKGPLIDLAAETAAHLESGGRAILSGILHEQVAEVVDVHSAIGLVLQDRFDFGEWSTILLGKN